MILALGSYQFEVNEVSLAIARTGLVGDNKLVYAWQETWSMGGRLIRDTVSELSTAIRGLENAAKLFTGNVRLLFDDGTETEHYIQAINTLNGIHVIGPPSYPTSEGAEYVTYRTFAMALQAEIPVTVLGVGGGGSGAPEGGYVSWQQSVVLGGGKPLKVVLVPLNATPIEQLVAPRTPYTGAQFGEAVGLGSWPTPPKLMFTNGAIIENDITHVAPTVGEGTNKSNYPVRWNYRVVAASPLSGRPTRR